MGFFELICHTIMACLEYLGRAVERGDVFGILTGVCGFVGLISALGWGWNCIKSVFRMLQGTPMDFHIGGLIVVIVLFVATVFFHKRSRT